ncbi:hypothetical protein CYY_005972 [Polysphondylium violaceum]|uniref:EGF-like domain-containing protein n=1 Tax=Polysphondylium violaceum TaxID=133409 RepID=A0A8J4PSN0_9MYCE|nr:hypothetical protein CYY_005972 [Polysphondylium violaceum]
MSNNSKSKRLLYSFLGVLLLVFLFNASVGQAGDVAGGRTSDADCPYQALPADINSYFGPNNDFHFQETFYYDFKLFMKDVTFNVTQPSAFRVYIAPNIVDVDIWLYQNGVNKAIAHSSDSTKGGDESIYADLAAGSYKMRLLFFGQNKGKSLACPTLTMETSITPTAYITNLINNYQCPGQSSFPAPNIDLSTGSFVYDSDVQDAGKVMNVHNDPTTKDPLVFLKKYTFTLGKDVVPTNKWAVDISLGFDFMTGGSLGIFIQPTNTTDPKDLSCINTGLCTIGTHQTKGHSIIRTVFVPGTYDLWIYDQPLEKDYSISSTCTPFSFYINIQTALETESFLNCEAYNLPASFNQPGFMDDEGYLYFNDDVFLDLVASKQEVSFTTKKPSYFKAYIPDHRVDIDIKLVNSSGKTVVSSFKFGGEEEVAALIQPDTYKFIMVFYGQNADVFCDTYNMEVAISPTVDFLDFCVDAKENFTPSLAGLPAAVTASKPFALNIANDSPYYTFITDQTKATNITTVTFTSTQTYMLSAELESNFIAGDVRILLTTLARSSNQPDDSSGEDGPSETSTDVGVHSRNTHHLFTTIYPGTYRIDIVSGFNTGLAAFLPPCTLFTLSLQMKVKDDDVNPCWDHVLFPADLSSPGYLGTSDKIHISDTFLVPPIGLLSTSSNHIFNVTKSSIFRAYTPASTFIDVDISLYEDDKLVKWGSSFGDSEAVEYVVEPGKQYKMVLKFFNWPFNGHSPDCFYYDIQLAISPIDENPQDKCTDKLVPASLIPDSSNLPFHVSDTYRFTQNASIFSQDIRFNVVSSNAKFRAILTFDFVWNTLAFQLKMDKGQIISSGVNNYNRMEIDPIQLIPGTYILTVFEPFATGVNDLNLRNCVDFGLEVSLQNYDSNQVSQETVVCPYLMFPNTFNSPAYLSAMTNQSVYFQETILADVEKGNDVVDFQLTYSSLVRIFVPAHLFLDIDVVLGSPEGIIDSSKTLSEEIIYQRLAPGKYFIRFNYYGLGRPIPKVEDCASFDVAISIAPADTLTSYPSLTNQCTKLNPPPSELVGGKTFTGDFQRQLDIKPKASQMSFQTTKPGQIYANLAYYDLVTSMAMKLNGSIIVNGIKTFKTYTALYQNGHAFLNEIIPDGNWTLSIYDPYNLPTPLYGLKCAQYTLTYMLNTETSVNNACDQTSTLPSDFSSIGGGSVMFGGPQNRDGEIKFSGKNIYITKDVSKKVNMITFNVPTKTLYMRMFSSASAGNDVDFFIYKNGSDSKSLIYSSIVGTATDTAIWKLDPQETPYTLEIRFFKVNIKADCNYFNLEIEMKTADKIQESLLCPAKMPNEIDQVPPYNIEFPHGKDITISSDKYFFSYHKTSINTDSNGIFKYVINLEAQAPTLLFANLGFDFLSNDFNMLLTRKDSNGAANQIASGTDSFPTSHRDTFVTMYNSIKFNLTAGNYQLLITENMKLNSFNVTNACHYFSFSLIGQSQVVGEPPRVVSVSPASKVNHNPVDPLVLTVLFSEPLGFSTTAATLLDYINMESAILLRSTKDMHSIRPTAASIPPNNKLTIRVTFADGLEMGQNFELLLDASKFNTTNGNMFNSENSGVKHTYAIQNCDCSGHGTCQLSTTGMVCVCQDPWTGKECGSCKLGYHGGSNGQCIANTKCQDNSCSGHGKCNDNDGFPECQCNPGFTSHNVTSMCGACQFGYIGYPDCKPEFDDRSTLCIAPLLPNNLDNFEYMGYNGKLHLQDNYYVDVASTSHTTTFTIKEPSLFRAYTEPHRVDVDLWLYTTDANGDFLDVVDKSLAFGHEEVVLAHLDKGTYALLFRFYLWDKTTKINCETINLELSIDTVANLINYASLGKQCSDTFGNKNHLPDGKIPKTITANTEIASELYAIVDIPVSQKAVYFWNTTFEISSTDKIALVDIAIGYQFLPGDLSVLIQSGNASNGIRCKGSDITAISGCVFGDNEMNRNIIHATLQPGTYTLFIYAPEYDNVGGCAPFTFEAKFTFISDEEDFFNCDGDILPPTFNNVEFLNNGYLHLQDYYLVNSRHQSISFTLKEQSMFRAVGEQANANVTLRLADANGQTIGSSNTLFLTMAAGNYQMFIITDLIASSKNFCPVLNLEVAIQPSSTDKLPYEPNCPADGKSDLPIFRIKFPFIFEDGAINKQPYYSFPDDTTNVVAIYSFQVTQVAQFYTAVASEFLRADLRVNLYKYDNVSKTDKLFIAGSHDYNLNWLQSNLDPAQYILRIERPKVNYPSTLPPCIQFEFDLSVLPLAKVPMCSGERVPLNFNSIRFLGTEGKMHYESPNFIVPYDANFTESNIPISVKTKSIMRVYVSPHIVLLGIRLIDPFTDKTIVSGSNLINAEASFVVVLQPNYMYTFQIQYWKWDDVPPCNNFNMEIAVGPYSDYTTASTCPGNSDFWPPSINPVIIAGTSYSYSNFDNADTVFHFQQTPIGTALKSYDIPFTITSAANIHAQVGFDFLTGDLSLKISSKTSQKVYYGENRPNRNLLDIVNLPAGQYVLTIYEPYSSIPDIMGCSFFNYELYIEPYTNMEQIDGFYHYIPTTLDTYPYLGYNGQTHLQGEYMMYDGNAAHNQIHFSVFEPTLFRVKASILPTDESNVYTTVYKPLLNLKQGTTDVVNTFESIVSILQQGQYTLTFGGKFQNSPVDVELALEPLDRLTKELAGIALPQDCKDIKPPAQIAISPDGTYFYSEQLNIAWETLKTPSTIQTTKFTLKTPSLVFAQLGYQFLLGHLDLYITSPKGVLIVGKANRNINELNVVLPVGDYELTIINPYPVPNTITPHCTPYRLSISIRDASKDNHVDCSLFDITPWNLNAVDGGSSEFGGPIDGQGNLRLYGSTFIQPTKSSQNISFSVSEATLVSIFTASSQMYSKIDYNIYDANNNNVQAVSYYNQGKLSMGQNSGLFLVNPNGQPTPPGKMPTYSSYRVEMQYSGSIKGACPAFGMQILMKPKSLLSNQLACSSAATQLPNANPKLDSNGAYSEFISSKISGDYLARNNNLQYGYNISFETTSISRIQAIFSFDPLVTNFIFQLYSVKNVNGISTLSKVGVADTSAQYYSGATALTQVLSTESLKVGRYVLTISHPPLATPYFGSSIYGDLCFPYTYSLSILDKKTAFAGLVLPASGYNMDPTKQLTLSIQLTEGLYDKDMAKITCQKAQYVATGFYFSGSMNNKLINATQAICKNPDATRWDLVFPASSLVSKERYRLNIDSSLLFDDEGYAAVLPPQYFYEMIDVSCSDNGYFADGECQCAAGYQGDTCYNCAPGYINTNPSSMGSPICYTNQCQQDSCGCKRGTGEDGVCAPLGVCKVNSDSGLAQCTCSPNYNGTSCNRCANGYVNYPDCTPNFTCGEGCGKGTCDSTTGQCSCPSNFVGDNCQSCATGYSGKDCTKNGRGAVIALEVIAGVVAGALVIGLGIWYIRERFRSGVARYKMLPKFEIEDDYENDHHGSKFPGLYDSDDEDDGKMDKNNSSINNRRSGGNSKSHVFSFSDAPNSLVDSDDDDENTNTFKNSNNNNKLLFDM